jgi:uncharacterized protein
MTALLDAPIFMYAAGADHPFKEPCQTLLDRVRLGALDATTSAEVIQEILHRYVTIRKSEFGVGIARGVLVLINPVLPLTHAVVQRVPDLVVRYPRLRSRDLVHVATCLEYGLEGMITTDQGLDAVSEVRRLDPRSLIA